MNLYKVHSGSQGDVINDVFIRRKAEIGMVDEDPGKSHHRLRDEMHVVESRRDVELRRREDRHLIIIKPELEECFLRSMKRVDLDTKLPKRAGDLQSVLNLPNQPKHKAFQAELAQLYRTSREKNVPTFVTELADFLRMLLQRHE